MAAMYPMVRPKVNRAPATSAWTTLTTSARRHHAVTSSTAAQVRATTPRWVVWIFRSVRMRARTGNAVTDIDTPMNSANCVNFTSEVDSRG
jgi:hypothetical protein